MSARGSWKTLRAILGLWTTDPVRFRNFVNGPAKPRSVFLWRKFPVNWKKAKAAHLKLGQRGESCAVKLLKRRDCVILARDWRKKGGELDIVALDGGTIVFAEVKTRRKLDRYRPSANLTPAHRSCGYGRAGSLYSRGRGR